MVKVIGGLNRKIHEMAGRIKDLREIVGLTVEQMAEKTDVTVEEYEQCESGEVDLNFAFIYRCASALGVNVTDIIEGFSPTLDSYTVTRAGKGQEIASAHGMTYFNMAYAFKNRICEPLYVKSEFRPEAQNKPIELTTHAGQECDLVIEGNLKVQVGDHSEILGPGDTIYFNSDTPHGMIAVNGQDCVFYAFVLNAAGEPKVDSKTETKIKGKSVVEVEQKKRIYKDYIDVDFNENGTPVSMKFKNIDNFNFAFDLVDRLAKREPDKLAMLHISKDGTERRFTFTDIMKASNRCANYFKSLGIKKGDRVMLVLDRKSVV